MFDLENQKHLLMEMFDKAQEGMIVTDDKARIIACNRAFCDISGFNEDELIGNNPSILSSGRQDKNFYADMWQKIQRTGSWEGEVWNRRKDGSFYAELLTINKIHNTETNRTNYIGMMSDITKMKEHHASLEKLAHYDALTGLPNRNLLEDRFEQAVSKADRHNEILALCFLDLDNFKPVNDEFGHNVGDELLIELAKRVQSEVRREDTVSRYGGDEFVILLTDIQSRRDCDKKIKSLLDIVEKPYKLSKHNGIKIGASIGYTLYPFDKGSLDSLIEHADQTLYQIKNTGKSSFLMYGDDSKAIMKNHDFRHAEVITAIESKQLKLFFQPKIDITSGEIIGFEALIRWNHPERGLLNPIEFLPSINESDVEVMIGDYVIREALRNLSNWHNHGLKIRVSVNLSAFHLSKDDFAETLKKIAREFPDVDFSYLQIEILESYALDDLSSIKSSILNYKKDLNISTALDDFGTGYSSLTHVRSLPIDTIKIDQSFVRNMLMDADDYKIVESVISLANSFNVEVIAEGVESIKHAQVLICMGCKVIQGYAISKPMPSSEVIQWSYNFSLDESLVVENELNTSLRAANLRLMSHFVDIEMSNLETLIYQKNENNDYNGKKPDLLTDKHCTFWLNKSGKMQLFEDEILAFLDERYGDFSQSVYDVMLHHDCGDTEAAKSAFQSVKNKLEQVHHTIKAYMLNNSRAGAL